MLLLWTACLLAIAVLFVSTAKAHSWYDQQCCSDNDCKPDDRVKEVQGGYLLPDGVLIPYGDKRLRASLNDQFHWCHNGAITYCLYIPGRST
jgi:hypothetical protein